MHCFFIAPTGFGVGLTSTSLGLVRALELAGLQVGFLKPVAQPHPGDHHGSQRQAGGQAGAGELPQQGIGHQLDGVGQQEEAVHGGDVAHLVHPLRQQVHQDWRPTGMGNEAGEAGDAGQQAALEHLRLAGCLGSGGIQHVEQEEGDGDAADHQADQSFAEQAEAQGADQHPHQCTRQHDLQVVWVPLAVEAAQPGDVRHAEDRQHDGRRLGRRHHQRQQRHRDATQGAAEAAFGNARQQDGGNAQEKELGE